MVPMGTQRVGSLGILLGGGNTAWERLVEGVRPPHGPPPIHLIGVLVGFASRFANILVSLLVS